MITVEGVTKRYGELVAVNDLSFEVMRGEVVGFLGPNGAGKSTTMRIITGAMQPDEGTVLFDGVSIGQDLPAAKRRVGYLPETNALYPDMLVSEYLEYTCELRDLRGPARLEAMGRAIGQTGI
ncbi:MAG TPA: ATP-binding cassette domain-containing protein, partial [Longimicrobiales bacterium]|nr:ATP-binding cassette domain-containing protein [Longimicrobiales bacterium]